MPEVELLDGPGRKILQLLGSREPDHRVLEVLALYAASVRVGNDDQGGTVRLAGPGSRHVL